MAALVALLRGSIAEKEQQPMKALTGPVVRGDIDTVRIHLKALESISDRRGLRFYRAFSSFLASLAADAELLPDALAEKMRALLEEPTSR